MAIKLYGSFLSTSTHRVMACLAEKDLEYEYIPIDMAKKQHKEPEFLSRMPFGQVPVLEDGDLSLFESRAITQYIAHAYADKGKDPKKMAILAVWMEVESHRFEPVSAKLVWELGLKPILGIPTDEAVVEENEKKMEEVLDVYESRLSKSKYLGGDCFTLADLHHLPGMKFLLGTKVKRLFDARPHVSAWATDIQSRPAWVNLKAFAAPSH